MVYNVPSQQAAYNYSDVYLISDMEAVLFLFRPTRLLRAYSTTYLHVFLCMFNVDIPLYFLTGSPKMATVNAKSARMAHLRSGLLR